MRFRAGFVDSLLFALILLGACRSPTAPPRPSADTEEGANDCGDS